MAEKIRISEAMVEFELYRKSDGKAVGTRRNDAKVLRRFLTTNGDLFVCNLAESHITRYMVAAAATRSESSMAIDHATLSAFFAWAVRSRYIGRFDNPMEGRKSPKQTRRERNRLAVGRFPALLDSAESHHRRDRMVVALGLYLLLRGSEIASLRIGNVDLDTGYIRTTIHKSRQEDPMPICIELDEELRSWLTYYTEQEGPLDPDWYLVPAKKPQAATYDPTVRRFIGQAEDATRLARLSPTRSIRRIEEIAQRALEGVGFPIRDARGASLREGIHTLRRSGARARFDELESHGYDGAIRHVQTMLHHATMAMTERYLGLTLDRIKRDDLVRGRRMFDYGTNVVELRPRAAGESNV